MAEPRILIVGAGPAGIRAAERLAAAGLRPVLIDEAVRGGGQIYRRQPMQFRRPAKALYGFEATRATAIHATLDRLTPQIDYRPETTAWALRDGVLHTVHAGHAAQLPFDRLILATGATDRLLPISGWTTPGCYTLGAAQIALKAQACGIGQRVVFFGTGPLLYLVAYQYVKAGITVAAVLDTSPFTASLRALPDLAARPAILAKGLYYRSVLQRRGVMLRQGVKPIGVDGAGSVTGFRFTDAKGAVQSIACDAVGMGFHLRSETQLADLAGCRFLFDAETEQWRAEADQDGRSSVPGIYLAGDGAEILGADAAEIGGTLAACALLSDIGRPADTAEMQRLHREQATMRRFRRGLLKAFPWPAHLARSVPDDMVICRCEVITAGALRDSAGAKGAAELNRAKAFSRTGMGRCQGRFCGSAAAEILAEHLAHPLPEVGRLRGQAPVKPLSIATAE